MWGTTGELRAVLQTKRARKFIMKALLEQRDRGYVLRYPQTKVSTALRRLGLWKAVGFGHRDPRNRLTGKWRFVFNPAIDEWTDDKVLVAYLMLRPRFP